MDADPLPTRRGKIACLPASIRELLNVRLHDGQQGPQILPWLNDQPEVLRVLDERFGEEPVTAQNLSEWRKGGFQDWLKKQERVIRTKQLAEYCRKIGDAGASEFGLPAALAGGQLMSVLEDFDEDLLKGVLAEDPAKVLELMSTVATLERARAGSRTVDQREKQLAQSERALDQRQRQIEMEEAKFQRTTAELFIKWHADEEARAILASTAEPKVKMDQLILRMFGQRPDPKPVNAGGG